MYITLIIMPSQHPKCHSLTRNCNTADTKSCTVSYRHEECLSMWQINRNEAHLWWVMHSRVSGWIWCHTWLYTCSLSRHAWVSRQLIGTCRVLLNAVSRVVVSMPKCNETLYLWYVYQGISFVLWVVSQWRQIINVRLCTWTALQWQAFI